MEKLLAAGEGQFLLTASVRPAAVDRYYVHAWGLAYYLTFEKHLLGSPALEKYLQSGNARLAPVQRFQQLIGMPLEQFEQRVADVYPRASEAGVGWDKLAQPSAVPTIAISFSAPAGSACPARR